MQTGGTLKDFVEQTLVDIAEGVHAAQKRLGAAEAKAGAAVENKSGEPAGSVEFELCVTSEVSSSSEGSGGLKISLLHLARDSAQQSAGSQLNRLVFAVPLSCLVPTKVLRRPAVGV